MEALDTLIDKVKSCAAEVYGALGAGYIENIYEEAMAVEFRRRKMSYEVQRDVEVFYKGEKVGIHKLDFIIDDKLVLELKSATSISKSHVAQTGSYLKTLGMRKGLLINFPYPHKDQPEIDVVEI